MTREEVKDAIHADPFPIYSLMEKAKDGKSYICPFCGHGKGGDGITLDYQAAGRFHCFACDKNGDAIDLYQQIKGTTDFNTALYEVANLYGLQITPPKAPAEMTDDEKAEFETRLICSTLKTAANGRGDARYTEYLNRRGISPEIAEYFGIGFIAEWQPPKLIAAGSKPPASPRLIIPTGKSSYLARDTRRDQELPDTAKPYTKQKAGGVQIFNADAIRNATRPLFIVEGEIDAISFYEVDAQAVGLGSAGNVTKFIDTLKATKQRTREPLIIALDNDAAGKKATATLAAELDAMKVRYYVADPDALFNGEKDANDALIKNRAAFAASVRRAECMELYQQSNASHLIALQESFARSPEPISTGFNYLDEILDGGLMTGLYFFGGVSSSGKTAVCMQIIDQVAKAGGDCIVFAAEMSRADLIARSISRETVETGKDYRDQCTQREVQAGYKYKDYSATKQQALTAAFDAYSQYAERITVYENTGDNMKPSKIRQAIKRYCHLTGSRPLVLIDYLQILTPEDNRQDIRNCIDDTIRALKSISTDYGLPIMVISSLNRDNYTAPLNLAAFKESGNIEYAADYLLGLQFSAVHTLEQGKGATADRLAVLAEEKKKVIRDVEITILKQRAGRSSGTVKFAYNAARNHYAQSQTPDEFINANYTDFQEQTNHRANLTGHAFSPDDAIAPARRRGRR